MFFLLPLLFGVPDTAIGDRAGASAAVPAIRPPIATPDYRYASPTERNVDRAASGTAAGDDAEENGQCQALRAAITDAMILRDQDDVVLPGERAKPWLRGAPNRYGKRAQLETRYRQLGCR